MPDTIGAKTIEERIARLEKELSELHALAQKLVRLVEKERRLTFGRGRPGACWGAPDRRRLAPSARTSPT